MKRLTFISNLSFKMNVILVSTPYSPKRPIPNKFIYKFNTTIYENIKRTNVQYVDCTTLYLVSTFHIVSMNRICTTLENQS